MLELMLCSMLTILPDYLFRRYVQKKKLGREITLYSVWYELRYGISACLVLTISLITTIFYFHPATTNAVSFFRTIPILTEGTGRVVEVYVGIREKVKAGQPLFKIDSTQQEAAVETARRRITEAEAAIEVARSQLAVSDAQIQESQSSLQQAVEELDVKLKLQAANASTVAEREIEKLRNVVAGREAALAGTMASKQLIEIQLSSLLPSQKATAEAALAEAQVALAKTVVYAGVDGTLEQFTLRPGDIVTPIMRPAGVLIPTEAGRRAVLAGFGQIEAQVIRVGMFAEITCAAKPFTIIPMVVTDVQEILAAGQVRASDTLIDVQQVTKPGTITAFLEPLYEGGIEGLPPGSSCIANAYTSNHDQLDDKDLSTAHWFFLHAVDTLALVHAMILRMQALLLPVQTLVLGGH